MIDLPSFKDVPQFGTVEEAEAWMAERENALRDMVDLAHLMEEFARTFTWWNAEDGMKVGYSTIRMADGKFGWCVLDPTGEPLSGMVKHGVCRLRKQAKAHAFSEFSKRSPKWTQRHNPNDDF